MEHIHMNHLRDLIGRLRAGESERRIAQDMRISRPTVHKYHELVKKEGYLEAEVEIPDDEKLQAVLGPGPQPPKNVSSVETFGEIVKTLRKQEVEMVAIWQRLRDNYGYAGSYSAIRRYVHQLEPQEPKVYARVQTAPGQEMQVDFGEVGQLYDPASGTIRSAYVFVATLSYSRHQYAELVFDPVQRPGPSEGGDLDWSAPAGIRIFCRCASPGGARQPESGGAENPDPRCDFGRSVPQDGAALWVHDQPDHPVYAASQGQSGKRRALCSAQFHGRANVRRPALRQPASQKLGSGCCRGT